MKRIQYLAAITLLTAAAAASAAPVDYRFDSVSSFDTGRDWSSVSPYRGVLTVTGILQNASTPTTVSFGDAQIADGTFLSSRCVPIFLTMIEKPGRYVLKLSIDTSNTTAPFLSCGLEVKS